MAVKWESDTMQRSGELWGEYPEVIAVVAELNGRHENTDIDSLVADIEANGQHTPCGFRKGDNGETILIYGHRRYRAVIEINKRRAKKGEQPIKLLGTYHRIGEQEAFLRAISENRERKDVSPIDDAANIGTLIEKFHYSLEEIAHIYFPDAKKDEAVTEAVRYVKQRHALLELAPEGEKAVRDGRIKLTAAVHLAKLSRQAQRDVIARQPTGRIKVKVVAPAGKQQKSSDEVDEAAVVKLAKKLTKELKLEDMEQSDMPYFEVPRETLIAIYKAVNQN